MEYIVMQKREITVLNTAENGERILNTPQARYMASMSGSKNVY
jgi:hypothetical protein